MERILGLAYVFPPGDSVANRRYINFVKSFRKLGFDTFTISSSEALYRRRGISLNYESPFSFKSRGARVCSSSPAFLEKICWTFSAVIKGVFHAFRENPAFIFATGDPWFVVVSGALISLLAGKPFIADIRDPWSCNPFIKRGKTARIVESLCLARASAVFLTTEDVKQLYVKSFPRFSAKFHVIKNGIDEELFENIEDSDFEWSSKDRCSLLFSGNITPLREPALDLFFLGLASCGEDVKGSLRAVFYTASPDGIISSAKRAGVENLILVKDFVPLGKLLSAIKAADACLLLDYSMLETATKLIEYISSSKTVFAVIPAESGNARLIRDYGAGIVCGSEYGEKNVAENLKALLDCWRRGSLPFAGKEKRKDFLFSSGTDAIEGIVRNIDSQRTLFLR